MASAALPGDAAPPHQAVEDFNDDGRDHQRRPGSFADPWPPVSRDAASYR